MADNKSTVLLPASFFWDRITIRNYAQMTHDDLLNFKTSQNLTVKLHELEYN